MVLKSKITKKINPRDEELLKKIKIKKHIKENLIVYSIYVNNTYVGHADIIPKTDNIYYIEIYEDEYRRKGIATYVYDYIEQDLNIKIKPSKKQLSLGKLFWKSR